MGITLPAETDFQRSFANIPAKAYVRACLGTTSMKLVEA
jgi:hypothetical protein